MRGLRSRAAHQGAGGARERTMWKRRTPTGRRATAKSAERVFPQPFDTSPVAQALSARHGVAESARLTPSRRRSSHVTACASLDATSSASAPIAVAHSWHFCGNVASGKRGFVLTHILRPRPARGIIRAGQLTQRRCVRDDSFARRLRAGWVTRGGACSRCGSTTLIDGHHEDYSKPLEVVWLCRCACHRAHHEQKKRTAA